MRPDRSEGAPASSSASQGFAKAEREAALKRNAKRKKPDDHRHEGNDALTRYKIECPQAFRRFERWSDNELLAFLRDPDVSHKEALQALLARQGKF